MRRIRVVAFGSGSGMRSVTDGDGDAEWKAAAARVRELAWATLEWSLLISRVVCALPPRATSASVLPLSTPHPLFYPPPLAPSLPPPSAARVWTQLEGSPPHRIRLISRLVPFA